MIILAHFLVAIFTFCLLASLYLLHIIAEEYSDSIADPFEQVGNPKTEKNKK